MNISLSRVWALVDTVEVLVHKVLGSRKAMATIGGVVAGLTQHNTALIGASILGYLVSEGYVDSKSVQFAQAVVAEDVPVEEPAPVRPAPLVAQPDPNFAG